MATLKRTAIRPLAGILASRQHAHPALLRMLSRARRRNATLLLVRIAPQVPALKASGPDYAGFLIELAADLRISDLAWRESNGDVLLLLEDASGETTPMLERWRQRAGGHGLQPRWRCARFPEEGLTLHALLEAVQWAA